LSQAVLNKKAFVLGDESVQALKAKIEAIGTPLKEWDVKINYGIKTGFNEAFIIDTATKERLCAEDANSAEIIKPVLRGRDIKRYGYEWAGLWIIVVKYGFHNELNNYPAVLKHLTKYEEQLKNRGQCRYSRGGKEVGQHHWLELDNNPKDSYLEEFEKEKVVWGNLSVIPNFAFCGGEMLIAAPANLLTVSGNVNIKYFTSILNSKFADYVMKQIAYSREQGFLEYKKVFVEQIPIPKVSESQQQPFIKRVEQILALKQRGEDTRELENEIDAMVFDLYQLTEQEMLDILITNKTSEADRRDIQAFFRRLQREKK